MGIVRRSIKTFLEAKEIADILAIDTNTVYSVRHSKPSKGFNVVTGMTGDVLCAYVARPATLRHLTPDPSNIDPKE